MKVIILGLLLLPICALSLGVLMCLTEWFGNLFEKIGLFVKYTIKKIIFKTISHFMFNVDNKAICIAYSYVMNQKRKELFTIEDIKIWNAFN